MLASMSHADLKQPKAAKRNSVEIIREPIHELRIALLSRLAIGSSAKCSQRIKVSAKDHPRVVSFLAGVRHWGYVSRQV